MNKDILIVKKLKKYFPSSIKGVLVKAVDEVDFTLQKGEILGLVGESGSGKSTIAYTLAGIYPSTSGNVFYKGEDISTFVCFKKRPLSLKKDIQIVFQDPGTSLNPRRRVSDILALPLKVHHIVSKFEMRNKIIELLKIVELPVGYMYKYPAVLGGGERQLVAIARALATNPSFIILDEPTSALDVSIQAKIIDMLLRLQKKSNYSFLFITHDMSLMRNIADRIAIIYLGKIVEIASTKEFFRNPLHPYTKMLISSIPVVTENEEKLKPKRIKSQGEIPSPVNIPTGCRFNTRCNFASDICFKEEPNMLKVGTSHYVRCHLYSNGQKNIKSYQTF